MDKSVFELQLLRQQPLHAFDPEDLTRMQAAFDEICRDEICPDDETKHIVAKAVIKAYGPKMDAATLLSAARFLLDGSGLNTFGHAWPQMDAIPESPPQER